MRTMDPTGTGARKSVSSRAVTAGIRSTQSKVRLRFVEGGGEQAAVGETRLRPRGLR